MLYQPHEIKRKIVQSLSNSRVHDRLLYSQKQAYPGYEILHVLRMHHNYEAAVRSADDEPPTEGAEKKCILAAVRGVLPNRWGIGAGFHCVQCVVWSVSCVAEVFSTLNIILWLVLL